MAVGPELVSEHGLGQGGRGIGGVAGSVAPVDWSAMLGESGLPANVVAELNRIFTRTTDINQAVTIGQAYVRSTPWYAQTFPGIQSGINSGLIADEQGYRAYSNQLTQYYRQYLNRAPTPAEIAAHLTQGQSVDLVGKQLGGQAYVQANLPQINQTLGAYVRPGRAADAGRVQGHAREPGALARERPAGRQAGGCRSGCGRVMLPSDRRDRDRIEKLLKRRPIDPLAPPKPTTPELMQRLTDGITDDYAEGADARGEQAKALMAINRKEIKE
jgi:hypothetical protein